ncbi:MAG: hypothetical protein MZV63_46775 [Marinilabiliales bacterium]|nr:hypothetical protein [Marinilabiliales bacterium]
MLATEWGDLGRAALRARAAAVLRPRRPQARPDQGMAQPGLRPRVRLDGRHVVAVVIRARSRTSGGRWPGCRGRMSGRPRLGDSVGILVALDEPIRRYFAAFWPDLRRLCLRLAGNAAESSVFEQRVRINAETLEQPGRRRTTRRKRLVEVALAEPAVVSARVHVDPFAQRVDHPVLARTPACS